MSLLRTFFRLYWPWLLVLAGGTVLMVTIALAWPQFFPSQSAAPGRVAEIAPGQPSAAAATGITQTAVTTDNASAAGPTPTPGPTPPPTATPLPAEELAKGQELHRLGDTVAARSHLAALLNETGVERAIRLQARFQLVKSYLADDAYSQALAELEQLNAEFPVAADSEAALDTGVDQELAAKSEFLRAVALAGLGRYGESLTAYTRFLDAYPQLAAAIQPRIARTHLALGDAAGAAAAYRAAVDAAGARPQKAGLLELLAQTYSTLGRLADSAAVYDEILSIAENPTYRAQIQYLAGETLALAGDEAGAIERWRWATEEAPTSDWAHDALAELVERQVDFDLYQRGVINVATGNYLPGINAFTAYIESVPPTDARAGNALHGLGLAYAGAGNFAAAVEAYDRVIAEYPECDCFGAVWLDKARAQAGLGDGVGARRIYRTFARQYPQDTLAPEALWRSGILAIEEGNQVEGAVDLLALADTFPASDRAPQALYTVGVGAFVNGLYVESADALTRLQTHYPDYRWDAAAYWRGRALQAKGEVESARAAWQSLVERAPDIYFGVLAAQALAQAGTTHGAMLRHVADVAGQPTSLAGDDGSQAFAEQWLAEWLQVDAAALRTLPGEVAGDPDLAIGRILLDLDGRGDALAALERVYTRHQNDPATLYALSLEFERLQTYRLSLLAMARLLALSPAGLVENAPIFLQQRAYPLRFAELITAEAQAVDVDPLVMFSLVRQESLFEEGARSVAAAQGLAQIIPDTGHWVADRLGYPNYSNALIYKPYINIKFGAYYLDWVRDYLDGNLVSALVGYNAGPGRSEDWRAQTGADDAVFVELLSIHEPQVYVQAIVSNLYHYNRLYANHSGGNLSRP
ncbi:MAG: transglycosylase SLT domain-containing protein [Caldilineaceae bacterium]|nr:transglycosylase SLT domain-containing protein [Caldilineaceae bacterium]